jgi:hypothetical protein
MRHYMRATSRNHTLRWINCQNELWGSSEKGAIIILAIFFFNLNSHFNLYNDVFEKNNDFEGQMGKLVF